MPSPPIARLRAIVLAILTLPLAQPRAVFAAEGWFDGSAFLPIGFSGPQNSFGSGLLADLDGDGRAELVIGDRPNDRVEVRRGLGAGQLGPPSYYDSGDFPMELAIGDVTGDAIPDVVVTNFWSSAISVLPGIGGAALGPRVSLETRMSPRHVGLADIDQDGRRDIVVACNAGHNFLGLFRSLPGGGFAPRVDIATGATPRASAVADLDGDGFADLVAACATGVAVHRGLGGGVFAPFSLHDATGALGPLEIVDVDGDEDLDVVVSNGRGCCFAIVVLRNSGAGVLAPGLRLGEGEFADGLAVADLDSDSIPEILTIHPDGNSLDVLRSTDGYRSTTQQPFQAGFYPQTLSVGDLDGDGEDDACVGGLSGFLALLTGNGDGTLGDLRSVPAGPVPLALDSGDLNGDGAEDLLVSHGDGLLRVQLNQAGDSFGTPSLIGSAGQLGRLVDLDHDGNLDAVGLREGLLTAARGLGNGTFSAPQSFPIVRGAAGLDFGDVNGDGHLDAVVAGQGVFPSVPGRVSTLFGRGDGTFAPEVASLPFANGWTWLALADFDADGRLDLSLTAFDDSVRLFTGRGDGTFKPRTAVQLPATDLALLAVRWNEDPWPDLLVCTSDNRVRALLGDGTGGLALGDSQDVIDVGFRMRAAQLDGRDGVDVIVLGFDGVIQVLRGDGFGKFSDMTGYGTCASGAGFALADVNRDGRRDLVVSYQRGDFHSILLNQGDIPTAALPIAQDIEADARRVRIRWWGAGVSELGPRVERREHGETTWASLGTPQAVGRDLVAYEDLAVEAGHRYGYRLAFDSPSGRSTSAETWIEVAGSFRLAFEGIHPNPAARGGAASITLTLPSDAPAEMQILDVQGRLRRTIAITDPAPGTRSIAVPRGWDVAPGMYFLRLRQGGLSTVRKLAITG